MMEEWIKTWSMGDPPSLPGLAIFATAQMDKIFYVGACPKSIADESQDFACRFGNVGEVLKTFYGSEARLFWWSLPREIGLIGQLPDILKKAEDNLNPKLKNNLPQLAGTSSEDLI